MAKARKAKSKKSKVKKSRPAARKSAGRKAKKTAKKPARPATRKPSAKKSAARKASAKKPAAKKAAPKKKQALVGEGDYAASRKFLKEQSGFVSRNKADIPAMGRQAAQAQEGPEGAALRAAEQEARDRAAID